MGDSPDGSIVEPSDGSGWAAPDGKTSRAVRRSVTAVPAGALDQFEEDPAQGDRVAVMELPVLVAVVEDAQLAQRGQGVVGEAVAGP